METSSAGFETGKPFLVHYPDQSGSYCTAEIEPDANLYETLKNKFPDIQNGSMTILQQGRDIYPVRVDVLQKVSKTLFDLAVSGKSDQIPQFTDDNKDDFEILMRCCQEQNLSLINKDNAARLLVLADKYAVDDVEECCLNYLTENVNSENVEELFCLADLLCDKRLAYACAHFLFGSARGGKYVVMEKNIDKIIAIGNRLKNKELISTFFIKSHLKEALQKLNQETIEKVEHFAKDNDLTDLALQLLYMKTFGDLFNSECCVRNGKLDIALENADVDIDKFKAMLKFQPGLALGLRVEGQECGDIVHTIIDKEIASHMVTLELNRINNIEICNLHGLFENLDFLCINECEIDFNNDSLFNFIPKSTSRIEIGNCPGFLSSAHVNSFSRLENLKVLDFYKTNLSNVESLAGIPSCVKNLTIRDCNLSNNHISSLSGLENLQDLDISENQLIDGSSFGSLPKNIQVLYCFGCSIQNDSIANLSGLKNLSVLDVMHNAQLDGSTFSRLPWSLRKLICSKNEIKHDISSLKNLIYCSIVKH